MERFGNIFALCFGLAIALWGASILFPPKIVRLVSLAIGALMALLAVGQL